MVLNICNFIQRTKQVPVELDISAIEEYILLLLLLPHVDSYQSFLIVDITLHFYNCYYSEC